MEQPLFSGPVIQPPKSPFIKGDFAVTATGRPTKGLAIAAGNEREFPLSKGGQGVVLTKVTRPKSNYGPA